jgi:hypothetical protein
VNRKTSAGKEGGAISNQRVYKRINSFYPTFSAELDVLDIELVSTEMYIPGTADFVNRKLVRLFIKWCINKISPTTSHVSEAHDVSSM